MPKWRDGKPPSKTLVYEDGRQRLAHVGLSDGLGCFCYMLDTQNVERFTFHPMNDRVADAEETARREAAKARLAALYEQDERDRANKLVTLCEELLEEGEFPTGYKSSYKSRLASCKYERRARKDE